MDPTEATNGRESGLGFAPNGASDGTMDVIVNWVARALYLGPDGWSMRTVCKGYMARFPSSLAV